MFARLGGWCHDRRRLAVVAWLAALVVLGGLLQGLGGSRTRSELELPNGESKRGMQILQQAFGGRGAGENGTIVLRLRRGADLGQVRPALVAFLDRVERVPGVAGVESPFAPGGAPQISARPGQDTVAFAPVDLAPDRSEEQLRAVTQAIRRAEPVSPGLDVFLGGRAFAAFSAPSSELLGLAFAVVILILAFGSVLAMGLPVGVALAGIGVGTVLAGLVSRLLNMPDVASTLGVMIGLGVGIDYALFIVTRFREQLHAGHDVGESVRIALDTAGRAVLFAGTTVVISLLGMLVMNLSFVTGLAVNAATVVAVTMVASLTLLPALLGFAGERVEVTRWRGLLAAGLVAVALVAAGLEIRPLLLVAAGLAVVVLAAGFAVAPLRRPVPRRPPRPIRETAAFRWSRLIQRRPWLTALAGGVLLVVLAIPVLSMRLGFADEGNFPNESETKQAYDLIARAFGPGLNGPLLLATELPRPSDMAATRRVDAALARTPGIAFAGSAIPNDPKRPTAAFWRVIPTSAPQDAATADLVRRLRRDVLPSAERGTGLRIAVTGSVAVQQDFSDYLTRRLLWFFAAVLSLSFLLLMAVFRSVLVPLKAVVMNLLSIGAAYGVVVAVFQWGWGASLIGVGSGPIEPFVPMMLFAIVFGLSMDYEVFLLSRVREEWDRTGDSHTSVADGLAATARVITAAAAIMVFVFGSFLLESNRMVKLFGMGLAIAVLLDATVVRLLLVPATMELLGDRNWWLPRWLDRLLPRVAVEGSAAEAGAAPAVAVDDNEVREPVGV